jgi:hypothetical protein
LAALDRALEPLSKLVIGNWYEQTILRRLWGFDKSAGLNEPLRELQVKFEVTPRLSIDEVIMF